MPERKVWFGAGLGAWDGADVGDLTGEYRQDRLTRQPIYDQVRPVVHGGAPGFIPNDPACMAQATATSQDIRSHKGCLQIFS